MKFYAPPARMIGAGIESVLAARAARAAVDLENLTPKILGDMVERGWTKQGITDTTQQAQEGATTYIVSNKYTGGTATEYVSPSTGDFVVVDNGTKQVIQVSRHDFLPNHLVK